MLGQGASATRIACITPGKVIGYPSCPARGSGRAGQGVSRSLFRGRLRLRQDLTTTSGHYASMDARNNARQTGTIVFVRSKALRSPLPSAQYKEPLTSTDPRSPNNCGRTLSNHSPLGFQLIQKSLAPRYLILRSIQ